MSFATIAPGAWQLGGLRGTEGDLDERPKFNQIRDILPIRLWLRSEYYLGEEAGSLYNFWEDVLVRFFDGDHERGGLANFNELILTGSIGTGKSYAMLLALMRSLYCLTCFDYPQSIFGLSRSKQLLYIYLSVSLGVTEITGFHQLSNMVDQIPYFKEVAHRNPNLRSRIELPKQRLAVMQGSGAGHFIGSDLFGAVLDEANFAKPGSTAKNQFIAATSTYQATVNRRISRFLHKGKLYGFSGIASSSESQSSFVEKRIEENKENKTIMVVNAKLWDVRPERFSHRSFHVFTGNETMDATIMETRIVDPKDKGKFQYIDDPAAVANFKESIGDTTPRKSVAALLKAYPGEFLSIPVDFYDNFRTDMDSSLKDLGGYAAGGASGLPVVRDYYNLCFRTGRHHPFTKTNFILSTKGGVEVSRLVDRRKLRPVEGCKYFVHIDLSEVDDRTGVSMVHREVVRGKGFSDSIYIVDFMLQILPPRPPQRLSIRKVREFVIWLKQELGFNITLVTADRFGSAETLQEFNAAGIEATVRSVDRTDSEYMSLANLINEQRLLAYFYEPFDNELWKLERDRSKQKVDHPPGGSKDVSDSLAGALANCLDYYADTKPSPSPGALAELLGLARNRADREDMGSVVVGDYESDTGEKITNLKQVSQSRESSGEGRTGTRSRPKPKPKPKQATGMELMNSLYRRRKKR